MEKKKKNSFKMLIDAAKNCRHEMWKAVQVLLVITLVLAVIYYVVESAAQPDVYGGAKGIWNTVVWAFTQYIGDPGKFATNGPVTFTGRLVATLIGIVKILIFAVPAGMIGSGFSKAIKDDKRAKELEENNETIHKAFAREQCRHTRLRVAPRFKSVVSLQVNQNLTEEDIIDTVKEAKDLRLRNLADTYSINDNAQDKLVVEIFPMEGTSQDGRTITKTEYGCKIDRESNVTIVSTSSTTELGNSHFAYYLAQFGGFNFVSKEESELEDSYYIISKETTQPESTDKEKKGKKKIDKVKAYNDFLGDITKNGKSEWVIFILQTQRSIRSQFSFVHKTTKKVQEGGIKTTVKPENEDTFLNIYNKVETMLANKDYKLNPGEREEASELHCDLDECFTGVGEQNISYMISNGEKGCNAFTIRIAAEIIARNNRDLPLALRLAQIIQETIGSKTVDNTEKNTWKTRGIGFQEAAEISAQHNETGNNN